MSRRPNLDAVRQPEKATQRIKGRGKSLIGSTAADEKALERLRAEIQKGIDSLDDLEFSFEKLRATLDAEDHRRKRQRSVKREESGA